MSAPSDLLIGRFVNAAHNYIKWVDDLESPQPIDMLRLHGLLGELQAAVVPIGYCEPPDDSPEVMPLSEHSEKYVALITKFKALPIEHYWNIFDPLQDSDPVEGSIHDDLADIYLDICKGLRHFSAGRIPDAVWAWRWGYFNHWGRHLVDAQSALREYLQHEAAEFFSKR